MGLRRFSGLISIILIILLTQSAYSLSTMSNPITPTELEVNQSSYNGVRTTEFDIPELDDVFSYNLDIVFLGFDQSRIDITLLQENLLGWYAPIDRYDRFYGKGNNFDVNYTINYDYNFVNGQEINEMRNEFFNNSLFLDEPWYSIDGNDTYYIPSTFVESYLRSNYMSDDTPTFFVIDLYTVNPQAHHEHLYNASEIDLDGDSIPRPYGSFYQNAGGGKENRLLWIDLSVGGIDYRENSGGEFENAGVNETLIPNVWDSKYNSDPNALTLDISKYINTAVELRYLPSQIYSPGTAYENVNFEMRIINLDTSGFDFMSEIDGEMIAEKYSALNPNLNWKSYVSEYDWQSDQAFNDVLTDASDDYNPIYEAYNASKVLEFLDETYENYFNSSTEETLVIPIFLFAFPGSWSFSSFLGIANNIGGEFAYVVSVGNVYWSESGYKLYTDNLISEQDFAIPANDHYLFATSGGYYFESFNTTLNVDLGTVNIYLVDEEDYFDWLISDLSDFNPLFSETGVTTTRTFTVNVSITDYYYWIIEDVSGGSTIDIEIDQYRDRSFGFTFVTMHEVGHAIGISHPHDGYSWEGNGVAPADYDYLYWLWDMSYTQMTYAVHHQEISVMDKDTYQRTAIPFYFDQLTNDIGESLATLGQDNIYIPELLYNLLTTISTVLDDVETRFNDYSKSINLNESMNMLFEVIEIYEYYESLASDSQLFSHDISITIDGNVPVADLTYEFNITELDISVEGQVSPDGKITLDNIPWADYELYLIYDGKVIEEIDGNSWKIPDNIQLTLSTTSEEDGGVSFLNTNYWLLMFSTFFGMVIILRKRQLY